jgi:hypothetical protein
MDHPAYSPDLAPADFSLFLKLKSVLRGKRFSDVSDIKSSAQEVLTDIPVQEFKNCFQQWPKHWEHCTELWGYYSENSRLLISAALKINV